MLDTKFYEKSVIKPGYGFYKAIVEANKQIPLKYLHGINIPDFLITIKSNTFYVYKGKKGFVVDGGVNLCGKFEEHVLDNVKFNYKEKREMPVMLNRIRDDFDLDASTMRIFVKSYKDLREKKEFLPPDYGFR